MAKDSFQKRSVGKLINQHFIPILMDRELEPEVDDYLQAFMTQQRGFGGWPLNIIFTPNKNPIAGFSYQTPDDLENTITSFSVNWQQKRQAMEASAERKAEQLKSSFNTSTELAPLKLQTLLNNYLEQSQRIADNEFGGFGTAEKFPFAPQLSTLLYLDRIKTKPSAELREFLNTSLQAMIGGGLRDHVGGGFFRYSDNKQWTAPHFEQMLYTQALIAPLLLQAGEQWNDPAYTEAGSEVLLGMINYFQKSDGSFRAALSAVSEMGNAGEYYLWSQTELKKTLGKDVSAIYPLKTGSEDKNLPLIMTQGLHRMTIRQRLFSQRQTRQLSYDDKSLLGWNGLALAALSRGHELHPSISKSGRRLFKQLEPLLTEQTLPQLIAVDNAEPAQLTDQVYFAYGLFEWALVTDNVTLLERVSQKMLQIYQNNYADNHWKAAIDKPLIGNQKSRALVDTQLPSATGLWLLTSNQLINYFSSRKSTSNEADLKALRHARDTVVTQLPDSLVDDAFFHGTNLRALLYQTTQNSISQEQTH